MARFSNQQIETRYQKLPDALKDAMFSADVSEIVLQIGKKYGLAIDKIGFLADEIGYIIVGLAHPNEFSQNLARALGTNENKTREIAAEVNHQIFFPLREALKKNHQFDVSVEEIQKREVPSPKPTAPTPTPIPPVASSSKLPPPIELKPLAAPATTEPKPLIPTTPPDKTIDLRNMPRPTSIAPPDNLPVVEPKTLLEPKTPEPAKPTPPIPTPPAPTPQTPPTPPRYEKDPYREPVE